jgi:glycopeptide antibiotics resistance protein
MIKTVWRMLLVFWLVSVVIVISLPGEKFDGTPHWESIQWIPFAALSFQRDVVTETLANFLAFVPLGYLAIRSFAFSIELYQLFCRSRVPSSTDLILNTAGAVLGAHLALKLDDLISIVSHRLPFAAPHRNAEE